MCFVLCVYFHACTSRLVLPCMYFHETCTLHAVSKGGPHKHVTGMQCSIRVTTHHACKNEVIVECYHI